MNPVATAVADTIPPVPVAEAGSAVRVPGKDGQRTRPAEAAGEPLHEAPAASQDRAAAQQARAEPGSSAPVRRPESQPANGRNKKLAGAGARTKRGASAQGGGQPTAASFLAILAEQIAGKADGTAQVVAPQAKAVSGKGSAEVKSGLERVGMKRTGEAPGPPRRVSQSQSPPAGAAATGRRAPQLQAVATAQGGPPLQAAATGRGAVQPQAPGADGPARPASQAERRMAGSGTRPGSGSGAIQGTKGANGTGRQSTGQSVAQNAATKPTGDGAAIGNRGNAPQATTEQAAASSSRSGQSVPQPAAMQPQAHVGSPSGQAALAAAAPGRQGQDSSKPIRQVVAEISLGGANGPAKAGGTGSGDGAAVSTQPIVAAGAAAPGAVEIIHTSNDASPGPAAATPAPPAPPTDEPTVVGQLTETLRNQEAQAGQEIVVRLHPPELGSVRMTLHTEGDHVRGVVVVDSARTYAELHQEMPGLVQRLADSGVDLRRLDIVLNERADRSDDGGSSAMAGGEQGRQGQGTDEQHGEAGPEAGSATQVADDPQQEPLAAVPTDGAGPVGAGSINVWI